MCSKKSDVQFTFSPLQDSPRGSYTSGGTSRSCWKIILRRTPPRSPPCSSRPRSPAAAARSDPAVSLCCRCLLHSLWWSNMAAGTEREMVKKEKPYNRDERRASERIRQHHHHHQSSLKDMLRDVSNISSLWAACLFEQTFSQLSDIHVGRQVTRSVLFYLHH